MTALELQTVIAAPAERCFDLARSMDFHRRSMAASGEQIVGGRSTGLIELGEEVEFEAHHLGLTRRLRARITEFDRPRRFVDEQVRGPFRTLRHEHVFESLPGDRTRLTGRVQMHVGWNIAGLLVELLLIRPHLHRVLRQHQANIKSAAESHEWTAILPPAA